MILAAMLSAVALGMCGATDGGICDRAPSELLQPAAVERSTTFIIAVCESDGHCRDHRVEMASLGACLEMRRRFAGAAIPGMRAECTSSGDGQ